MLENIVITVSGLEDASINMMRQIECLNTVTLFNFFEKKKITALLLSLSSPKPRTESAFYREWLVSGILFPPKIRGRYLHCVLVAALRIAIYTFISVLLLLV